MEYESIQITLRLASVQLCSLACQMDFLCQSWTFYNSGSLALSCFLNYDIPQYVSFFFLSSSILSVFSIKRMYGFSFCIFIFHYQGPFLQVCLNKYFHYLCVLMGLNKNVLLSSR